MTPPLTPPNESTMQFGQSALWDVPDMYFPGMSPYISKFPNKAGKAAPGTPKGKGKVCSKCCKQNKTMTHQIVPNQGMVLWDWTEQSSFIIKDLNNDFFFFLCTSIQLWQQVHIWKNSK